MADLFSVAGKVAVVIGGAGGIGEACALGLAQYGANVVVASRNLSNLQNVAQRIRTETSSQAMAFQVDVTDEQSVANLVEQVVSEFGTVDILVNSQGVNIKQAATEFLVADWDVMFNVNVRGIMLACREFGKVMTAKGGGKVINLSSVRGIRATLWGGNEGYAATKGAVDMITRSLASEWAPYNINVNAIAPATVVTPFSERTLRDPERLQRYIANIPLKRVGEIKDVVGACIFLASPASDFITGQILYLDGGLTAIG
jgi:NAD(P)-dependent dehydrogenase (short-subunit alcohol dehydrogenase family)